MSAKSSIQVCIKVRPCEPEMPSLWQVKDKRTIHLIDGPSDPCIFDYVFDQGSNNQEVFDGMAKHIVEACVKGFNGTIFAYGQTSSGKTYTMMGDRDSPGVMVLAAKEIFNQISNNSDRDFLLRVGYIEIYNEKIYDLLNKKNQDLKIQECNGMVNVNSKECIITSEESLLQLLCMGNKERSVGGTNMNERSSRSHAIFRIIIESRKTDRSEEDAVAQSILNLVDLAGSERADQTGASGARLKEGSHINKSLLFLSNVIKSLSENEDNRFVNYRDSKLTRILQTSLGGNAFTSIICTIRPSNMEESQSTLSFAIRAKKIHVKPQLNEIVSDATMMKRLEREIKMLKDRLAEEQAKNESQLKVRALEQRIKTETLNIITSNTVTDHRNKIRRRTWCPASSNPELSVQNEGPATERDGLNAATFNINVSKLPKPSFYPPSSHPNQRGLCPPKTINILKSHEIEEELISVVEPNFEQALNPSANSRVRLITLTPTVAEMGAKGREMIEREVVELEAFTRVEQHINSEWEELKEKLFTATAKIEELQAERLKFVHRSEALQADVDVLRESKEEADAKIANYEEQLQTLKQTVDRLEMENRAAVELEFQFSSHKTKSKLRETELLTALSEKESAIDNLQKSLNELSNEVLRNSKDDHMRSICPTLETSCELICKKCVDLERLLEEFNNRPSADDGAVSIDCECEQLRVDIAKTRDQLESVQNAYKQMSSDVAEKSDLCDRLSRDVISAEESKEELKVKYIDLEQTILRLEQIIRTMQEDYDAIQQKYNALQQDYDTLERTAAATEEQHKKLNSENESLQQEISTLKRCAEEIQLKLTETAASDIHKALVQQLQTSNEELMANLAQMEIKYGDLQGEYDDLSNQLMESVQDGDSLREECNALQERLKMMPVDGDQLQARIDKLEQEISEKQQLLGAAECAFNEMREQMANLQSELLEKSVIVNKVEDYQRQIESLEKQNAEMTMVCEELQEKVKETTINESMSKSTSTMIANDPEQEKEIDKLSELNSKLTELNSEVQELQAEVKKQLLVIQQKDTHIEELHFEIQELNERCISMDVQQVEFRSSAEQHQQLIDLQTAKLAEDVSRIDQLQASNAQLTERLIKAEEALEQHLKIVSDMECSKEEYENRIQNLQMSLENARKTLEEHEKLTKDELDNVKLEFLQKIEVSESRYRENLHKYNTEWQDRLEKLTADGEAELLMAKTSMDQLINDKKELESLYIESSKLVEQLQDKLNFSERERLDAEKERDLLTSSSEELQELHEKSEQQRQNYDQINLKLNSLKQENSALQLIVDDNKLTIDRLHQDLQSEKHQQQQENNKVLQLSTQLAEAIQANATAKAEYNEQLEALNLKINDMQEELNKANLQAKDVEKIAMEYEKIQSDLVKANECNKLLTKKADDLERELALAQSQLSNQKTELENLQSKLVNTLEAKTNIDEMEIIFTQKLQQLQNEMSEQSHQFERKVGELISSKAELNLKLESLAKRKLELESSNHDLTVKLKNELNMHAILEKEQEQNANLQQSIGQLQSQLQAKQTECAALQQSLQQLEPQLKAGLSSCETLQKSLELAVSNLETKQAECDALQQTLQQAESQLKIQKATSDSLQQVESQLQINQAAYDALKQSMQQSESQLKIKQAECEKLQKSLQEAKSQLDALQQVEAQKIQDAIKVNNQNAELSSRVQTLQTEIDKLRSMLKVNKSNFDADRARLDATICSLLEDKRNLEEKLCTTSDIMQKMELDSRNKPNSSNISCDSNTSSNTSPAARNSLDRESHQPRKSLSLESEVRRNRRITTHDERRQSYWNDSRHVACMTDPVDNNCNCTELDRKLKECQFELFISESKVTALNIELKNHPLKEENALLKKRLQDEQQKAQIELKRMKHKHSDLLSKFNANTAAAAISNNVPNATISQPQLANVETQTESELEMQLKKTTDKLNDCMQICRHRYNYIKGLEDRLKQKENSDTSNISSQTAGEIILLKSKLDIQNKEIITLTNKYEFVKKALKLRKEEIDKLRQETGTNIAASLK